MSDAGATLTECDFCGARQLPLRWEPGRGWTCRSCGAGMEDRDEKVHSKEEAGGRHDHD